MQSILLYSFSVFCVIECIPTYPTSYVYRSDGVNHGYTRTFSTRKDQEFRKVIVKREEIPLTVTSYSTFIIHPASTNYGDSDGLKFTPEENVFGGNYLPGKQVYSSRIPADNIPEDNVTDVDNDGDDDYDEEYYNYEDNNELHDDNEENRDRKYLSKTHDYVDADDMNSEGEQYDNDYNKEQNQWYHRNDEDIEEYISNLFNRRIGNERNNDPYGTWFWNNYKNDGYYRNQYY